MKNPALRLAPLSALLLLALATPARASDKADCAAALKAAQAENASGQLIKALTDLATCSRAVCGKPMQKQCTDLTKTVTDAQPTVVFLAKDAQGKPVTDVKVSVDGAVVATSLDGTPVPMDPGSHAIKFEADGASIVEKQVTVDPATKGQTIGAELDLNATKPVATGVKPTAEAVGEDAGSMWDTKEDPAKKYYFIGLRYRGDVIPVFIENIFVNGGKTVYSNSFGAEIDIRKDHFSLIPALQYTQLSTGGDVLFEQKSADASMASNWSVVNSNLAGVFLSVDLLWSVPIADHWDFEYGADFGLGVIFGSLQNDWVYPKTGSQISSSNYIECPNATAAPSCSPMSHSNATTAKVGGYTEPFWTGGGSIPNVFPLIDFPHLGFRYKPMKQLETRVGFGFSLTGFWFGLSADYGLETATK